MEREERKNFTIVNENLPDSMTVVDGNVQGVDINFAGEEGQGGVGGP